VLAVCDIRLYVGLIYETDKFTEESWDESLSWSKNSPFIIKLESSECAVTPYTLYLLCLIEVKTFRCNLFFDYCVHNSPPLDRVLNQMNPIYILAPYFYNIRFNIILPFLFVFQVVSSGFPTKILYEFITYSTHATCPACGKEHVIKPLQLVF
jgi:hypothetical protein